MHEQEPKKGNDASFDSILTHSLSYLPNDIAAGVTPWKKAITRVLTGMALTAITLNFWCLNYILPAVGMVLQLLGFRALRKENKWFKYCYAVSIVRTVYFFVLLILYSTIAQYSVANSAHMMGLTIANILLQFVLLVCLWRAFLLVQKKAELPPGAGAAVALIVWYALIGVLAFLQYSGLTIGLPMLIIYCFIIYNLYKLSKNLDAAGYAIQPAHVKITDRTVVILLVSVLLLGLACGYFFGGSYPMEWTPLSETEHNAVQDTKEHLLNLGFPDYVLNDLTAEDIAACDGALDVQVYITDISEKTAEEEVKYRTWDAYFQEDLNTYKDLRFTGVAVQVPGDEEQWMLFHHFLWTNNPGYYGTESIQMWPTYSEHIDGWRAAGEITGRVLYDNNGKSMTADYYHFGMQTSTSSGMLFGEQTRTDFFAAFSFPRGGSHCRCYLAYPIAMTEYGWIVDSWVNYTHQRSFWQYPVMTAMEKRMTNSMNHAGVFSTYQEAIQFNPSRLDDYNSHNN